MGLDDAIRSARAVADAHDEHLRKQALREAQEGAEIQQMLREAVEHLQRFGHEYLVRVRPTNFLATYTSADGRRFRQVSRVRCWRLAQMSGRRGSDAKAPWMESSILLLADATAGRYWLDQLQPRRRGEYVVSSDPDPLNWQTFTVGHGTLVEKLKHHLATAIVQYERTGAN